MTTYLLEKTLYFAKKPLYLLVFSTLLTVDTQLYAQ